jgi:DNA topoisomerase III
MRKSAVRSASVAVRNRCAAQRFRTATEAERAALFRIVAAMRPGEVRSTGKLYSDLYPNGEMSRDTFEEVLGAMARAGLVQVTDAVFEKNGKQIPYRKVSLTRAAYSINETTPIEFIMKETAVPAKRKGKRKVALAANRKRAKRPETRPRPKPESQDQRSEVGSDSRTEEALRTWRLAEARRRGVPAFRILSDQALRAMATRRPETARELLAIPGIAITTVEKYAGQFYRILQKSGG